MGTGQSGRYLNTRGSGRHVSDFALVHSVEGLFTKPSRPKDKLRLISGGHGEKGLRLLDKYGIKYNIVKTYPNGVRIGNIPNHKDRRKKDGIGQAWFPKSWTNKDIRRAGEHVAGLKDNRHAKDGQKIYGIYKGVHVVVIRTYGKIATIFPNNDQSAALRRCKRK